MKIKVTKKQCENALEALHVMWPSVPEANVSPELSFWNASNFDCEDQVVAPSCNSLCCFGGWCAWWPSFQKQGIYAGELGMPCDVQNSKSDHINLTAFVSRKLFGVDCMFSSRGFSIFGEDVQKDWSDHKVITNRLEKLIEMSDARHVYYSLYLSYNKSYKL